jgi:hypothetical protein
MLSTGQSTHLRAALDWWIAQLHPANGSARLDAQLAALRTADGPCGAITGRAELALWSASAPEHGVGVWQVS